MKITCKKITTISEFIDAIRIRVDVFIKEQKCKPGWEPDEEDKVADHYIALVNNEIVATARVKEINHKEYKIERMAVKKEFRRKGVRKGLVDYIVNEIKKNKPKRIWMQAQVQAQKFYEKCGFRIVSTQYGLHGLNIPHVDMEYEF